MQDLSDFEISLNPVQLERFVKQLDGAGGILLFGNDGQVQLRGSLSNHHDIDIRGTQHPEGSCRNAGNTFDALSHQSNDRDVRNTGDAVDSPPVDFLLELPPEGFNGVIAILLVHNERDMLLRRTLRKHQHADSIPRRGGEYAARDTGDADHAAAFDRYQGHSRN